MTTVTFGPLTCGVSGPLGSGANGCTVYDTGQTGTTISGANVNITASVSGYSGSAWQMNIDCLDPANVVLSSLSTGTLHFDSATTATINDVCPANTTRVMVRFGSALNTPDTASGTINGYYSAGVWPAYCAYGTQANPSAAMTEVITDTLIDLVVTAALAGTGNSYLIPYVATALAAIEGTIVGISVNCATFPGAGPTLDFPNLSTISTATLAAWFQNAAWRYFCQCVPAPAGAPDPIMPPPPPIVPPTTVVATGPGPVCDNSDLCSYLAAMKAQLQTITAQLGYLRTDVRVIQRQHVPFAYVPGTLHSGLTDAGQFAVSDILGLAVQVTTVPGASGEQAGDPIARFGLGWVTTGTANGWRTSVPIRHNPQWVDVAPDDTLVGYSLNPLVVANIEEFAAEP